MHGTRHLVVVPLSAAVLRKLCPGRIFHVVHKRPDANSTAPLGPTYEVLNRKA